MDDMQIYIYIYTHKQTQCNHTRTNTNNDSHKAAQPHLSTLLESTTPSLEENYPAWVAY